MEQRVSLTTLAVEDLEVAAGFYESLGWEVVDRLDDMVSFQLLDGGLALYRRAAMAADPEGHRWEVAHNPSSPLGDDGAFRWSGAG